MQDKYSIYGLLQPGIQPKEVFRCEIYFLDHISDALQWYESIHTRGDTWGLLIPPSTTLSKCNLMGDRRNRQFLSSEMMYKMINVSKLIDKIINVKTIFGPECYSFKSIFRASINYGYTYV